MYFLAVLMGSLMALAVGFHNGISARAAEERLVAQELSEGAGRPAARSLSYALSVVAQEGARSEGVRIGGKLAVEAELDKVERTPREAELYRVLGGDPLSARLRRPLIAGGHRDIPGADLYMKNFVAELAHDAAGTAIVKAGLDRMPASDYPLERVSLLSALAASSDNSDTVKTLALNELTQNPPDPRPDPSSAKTDSDLDAALSTTAAQARPIVAQGLFLKSTSDPGEALSGTISAITVQQDWGVRASLAQQFLQAFPDMGSQLTQGLAAQGITLKQGN